MLIHRLPPDLARQEARTASASFPVPIPSRRLSLAGIRAGLVASDTLLVLASLWRLSAALPFSGGASRPVIMGAAVVGLAAAWAVLATGMGLYAASPLASGNSQVPRAVLTATSLFAPAAIGAAIAGPVALAPLLCGLWIVLLIGLSRTICRLTFDAFLRAGWCVTRVVVLGSGHAAARLYAARLDRRTGGRLRSVASLAMPQTDADIFLAWVRNLVQTASADEFILLQTDHPSPAERTMVWQMVRAGAAVTVVPHIGVPRLLSSGGTVSADILAGDSDPLPLSDSQSRAKRAADIVTAVMLLLVAAPIWLLICIVIRLDSRGPVFFRQARHGHQGQVFRIWKFRTMRAASPDAGGGLQTTRDDARVTRIGRFLRRSSLDELPQLLNVLAGDMSVVGPRPHAVGMLVAGRMPFSILDDYDVRHDVKPGITGWAQVNGSRGELDTPRSLRRRFALDRYYIENWSIRLDVVIIARTMVLPFLDRFAF